MNNTKESGIHLPKYELNSKIVTLFLLIFSFSGINLENASALDNKVVYTNIYNKYNIYNKLNNINEFKKEKEIKKKSRGWGRFHYNGKSLAQFAKGRKLPKGFSKNIFGVMHGIKMHESSGNYRAHSQYSSACGAYQFIDSTWNNYGGYSSACKAPQSVQDQRMFDSLLWRYKDKKGDWEKVIAAHFIPAWADQKWRWSATPPGGGNTSVWSFVNYVTKRAGI